MLVVQTVSSGFGFYNMSVYMTELAKLLDTPLANVSFAVTLFFVMGGVTGIYVARWLEKVPVKWIMAASAAGCGICLYLVGLASQLWHVYLLFSLFGLANTGVSLVVGTTLITWWFPGRNRSVALAISSTGLSLGGIIVTPVTAYLFNAQGLPATMPWLGLVFVLLVVPIALFVVRTPGWMAVTSQGQEDSIWVYSRAVRSRFFVLHTMGYFFCMGAQVGGIAHLYGMAEKIAGFAVAAIAVQVLTACSIVGRFLGGYIVTRIEPRPFTLVNVVLQMTGLYLLSQADGPMLIYLGAGLFGLSVGNLLMMQPLWLADAFPGRLYPRIFALANALTVGGVALGPLFIGALYDMTGYSVAYLYAVGTSVLAFGVIWSAGPTAVQPAG